MSSKSANRSTFVIISISSTDNSFLSFCGETQSRNSLDVELQLTRYTLLVSDFNCAHVPFSISIINVFYLQRYKFSMRNSKLCSKSRTFAKSFRWQSFRGIKESALLLVKSPKYLQRIYKARSSSYTWATYPCCIFRCLAIPTREYGGQPTFFNNKHCNFSKLAVCGELL